MIRNAIDHGIETPVVRKKAHKPASGSVAFDLRYLENEQQLKLIASDDGGGINTSRLIEKAVESGLISKSQTSLSNEEIIALLAAPGISTKDEVSEISGRGVGLDSINEMIKNYGGTISLLSSSASGTSFEFCWQRQDEIAFNEDALALKKLA